MKKTLFFVTMLVLSSTISGMTTQSNDSILNAVKTNDICKVRKETNKSLRDICVSKLSYQWKHKWSKAKKEYFWYLDYLFQNRMDSLNFKDENGNTPLHIATENNNIKLVLYLLKLQADVNVQNNNGFTPLHIATNQNNKAIIHLLLNYGAHINQDNDTGSDVLWLATNNRNIDIVKLFLKHGANVNSTDICGNSPLLLASIYGSKPIVKLLLKYGANVNQSNILGITPLLSAVQQNNTEMVKLLINRGADIDLSPSNGIYSSPLETAIGLQHNTIKNLLIEEGASI